MSFLNRGGARPVVMSATQWAPVLPALCKGLPHRWYPLEAHERTATDGVTAVCLRCRATDPPPPIDTPSPWHR